MRSSSRPQRIAASARARPWAVSPIAIVRNKRWPRGGLVSTYADAHPRPPAIRSEDGLDHFCRWHFRTGSERKGGRIKGLEFVAVPSGEVDAVDKAIVRKVSLQPVAGPEFMGIPKTEVDSVGNSIQVGIARSGCAK